MKRVKIILFFLMFSDVIIAQDFISTQPIVDRGEIQEILSKNITYKTVNYLDFDLGQILEKNEYTISINNYNYIVKKDSLGIRGLNNYFLTASNEEIHLIMSVLDNDIQGVIETPENVYTIETYGEKYLLITVDYNMLNESCYEFDSVEEFDLKEKPSFESGNATEEEFQLKSYENYECNIRVLVLYTPNAKNSVSNILNTINIAMLYANQSFVNSQINYKLELAYVGETSYTETSYTTDLQRFRTSGDGYMEEVHTLRNQYSADICVLLAYDNNLCGIASGIGVTESSAFCLVSTYSTCATSNYSFVHEIGHLLGCRHDTYVDPTTTPYVYGHGYINPSKTWRTIMAYANDCSGCPRLLYWSNPYVTYLGETMGTTSTQNNSRVWNNQSNYIMNFRQPLNSVIVNSTMIDDADYSNIQALENIQTSGTININNETILTAGSAITLNSGFIVNSGTSLEAKISNVTECGECTDASLKSFNLSSVKNEDLLSNNINLKIFPNPTYENVYISYTLDSSYLVNIFVLNLLEEKVITVANNELQQNGTYKKDVALSRLKPGEYFIVCEFDEDMYVKKVILK